MGAGDQRRALVTGATGQDGSFLAELLLEKGYRVTALVRDRERLGASEHLRGGLELMRGDLFEPDSLVAAVRETTPDELYHLAAPSFVPDSWKRPAESVLAIAGATAVLLQAVRDRSPATRMFVAASGHIFGAARESPQREHTACRPLDPYSIAKLTAHQLVGRLRAHDGLYACSGILYNHESERRPAQFVSRKITRGAAAIKLGQSQKLVLGDLGARRDWSFAGDMARGAWLMLQQDEPDDYILASGTAHTVREMADLAFSYLGLKAEDHIRVDPQLLRTPEATPLVGDPTRAQQRLGWRPQLSFEQLVHRMVDADLAELRRSGPGRRGARS